MDLYQLRYFIALAEERGFTRAAVRCHVSQQALSRAIAKLEHRLGAPLVERRPRGCSLTDAGRAVLPEAYALVARADRVAAAARGADRHDFVVGVHDEGLAELTPLVCAAFRERHPDVRLVLRSLPYPDLPRAVDEGRVDALFCLADAVADRDRCTPVYEESAVLLTRAGDELAATPIADVADVLDRVYVSADERIPNHFYAPFTLGQLRGGERARSLPVPAPDTINDLIRQIVDDGAIIVTNASQERYLAHPAVRFVPMREAPPFTIGVVSGDRRPELQHSLVDAALAAARSDLALVPGAVAVGS